MWHITHAASHDVGFEGRFLWAAISRASEPISAAGEVAVVCLQRCRGSTGSTWERERGVLGCLLQVAAPAPRTKSIHGAISSGHQMHGVARQVAAFHKTFTRTRRYRGAPLRFLVEVITGKIRSFSVQAAPLESASRRMYTYSGFATPHRRSLVIPASSYHARPACTNHHYRHVNEAFKYHRQQVPPFAARPTP